MQVAGLVSGAGFLPTQLGERFLQALYARGAIFNPGGSVMVLPAHPTVVRAANPAPGIAGAVVEQVGCAVTGDDLESVGFGLRPWSLSYGSGGAAGEVGGQGKRDQSAGGHVGSFRVGKPKMLGSVQLEGTSAAARRWGLWVDLSGLCRKSRGRLLRF